MSKKTFKTFNNLKSFSCLICLVTFQSLSQPSIETSFNEVYIGQNQSVNFKNSFSHFSYSAGVTYHINRIDKIPLGTLIKNAAVAQNTGERFGVQLGFEYFLFKNSFCKAGLFYNNQISLISQVHLMFYAYDTLVSNPQSEFDFLYVKSERTFGPVFTSDNVIGITLQNKITNNIYLTTKGGFGFLLWKNTDESLLLIGGKKNNQSYNFTSFFSVGIGYTFIKNE